MPYTYTLPQSTAFTGTGLEGYSFGPLRQKDLDVYYIESEKGHDTFMVSKKISRTYYVISGSGYFTIDNHKYEVRPGMLVDVPPKVEYSYSGKMTLIGFARPRWFSGNDTHTRWNPDVTIRPSLCLPGKESWRSRLIRLKIAGKSPVNAYLRLNRRVWERVPSSLASSRFIRMYGDFLHSLSRTVEARTQAFNTHFLRNRPELELIQRLLAGKNHGETLKIAVLGCSLGPEAYSVAWAIRSERPDLRLILDAVDISPNAVEFAKRGVYSLTSTDSLRSAIFDRMTKGEKEEFFDMNGETASVKHWIREGIQWHVGDAGEPTTIDALGPQDMVVANNFLCHMVPAEAERCLRNIARLVGTGGYVFVSGVDLDVRTKVAQDLEWKPLRELLEEIHDGDPALRGHWPWHYGGLEPIDRKRRDWTTRYAVAFEVAPAPIPPIQLKNEFATTARRQ
jgi:chemotaxis methyl-accepting protein methylase